MRILIACEFSGRVREAFRKKGHDAWSCDLLPTEVPGQHIQDNVLHVLQDSWDIMIAHPPCTYLSNSGSRHLVGNPARVELAYKAIEFFNTLLDAPINSICIENPIQHGLAKTGIALKYTQIIQPWMFGHLETKATCLWLKNLPRLKATNEVYTKMRKQPKWIRNYMHYLPPSEDRWKIRSRTYEGIANAMAEQWS